MESHDLLIFKHVADSQSLSKAAMKLGYVQPNISQRIKTLETELGVPLFKRNNRGVTLTDDGAILLDYANQILFLMNEAKVKINPDKYQEHLVIGATQTISALKVPKLLTAFLHRYNQINVKVRTDTTSHLLEEVVQGDIDGAFVTDPFDNSELKSVYSTLEKVSLISANDRSIKLEDEQPLLVNSNPDCIYRRTLIHVLEKGASKPLRLMEFDSLEAILQSVSDGLGISLVPSNLMKLQKYENEFKRVELLDPIQIDFVVKNRSQQPKALKSLIKFLAEGEY